MNTNITLGGKLEGYTYTPLRGKDKIRIAYLSRVGNKLHARLEQVELSQSPKYCALSYVWRWLPKLDGGLAGNHQTKPIYLDGHEIQVTANLADFIDAITVAQPKATPDTPRPPPLPYWIDAICIDQADDAEKSAQVRMMREIYDKATCITIWLGRHDQDSRRCIDKMKMCATAYKDIEDMVEHDGAMASEDGEEDYEKILGRSGDIFRDCLQRYPEFLDKDGGLVDRDGWVKLGHFFHDRQWWDRMWTTQEYLPNAERIFLCGDSTFSPELFAYMPTFQMFLEATGVSCPEVWGRVRPQFRAVRKMEEFRQDFHQMHSKERPLSLRDTLLDLRHRVATDPRDKVFAVLGLIQTDRWEDPLLSIDYALPVATVFTNVARYLLERRKNLHWLGYAGSSSTCHLESRQYPSWVPDWGNVGGLQALHKSAQPDGGRVQSLYSPWGSLGHGFEKDSMACITESEGQPELLVKGTFLDEIQATYETAMSTNNLDTYLRWVERVENKLGSEYLGTREPMWRAALRTISTDINVGTRGGWTRSSAGLDDLAGLPMADRVHKFLFGDTVTTIVANIAYSFRRRLSMLRCLAVTRKGYICLAPGYARIGDQICAFTGGPVLYIVRREVQDAERYTFVGETYVHGLMDGEWRDEEGMGARDPTRIILV